MRASSRAIARRDSSDLTLTFSSSLSYSLEELKEAYPGKFDYEYHSIALKDNEQKKE